MTASCVGGSVPNQCGLLLCTLLIGCTADPRTEVLLVVDAEPEVRNMATHLELRVLGASADADDWREVRAQTLGSPVEWPRSLGLVPRDGESHRRFDTRAAARQGVDGPVVAQARVLSSYVPEQTRELRLTLEDACIGRSCAETETCRAGMCMPPEPIDPQSLVRLDGPPPRSGDCPEGMIRVPAAGATVTFVMGSPEGIGDGDERPQTLVTLDAYCLDRTEVTVAAYTACAGCTAARAGGSCNGGRADRATHPINCVDRAQAESYCVSRGARLPTEAEWEHAARGFGHRLFPWGDGEPVAEALNMCGRECRADGQPWDDGWAETAPVGSFTRDVGPYGHVDLAGNIEEWTGDCYGTYSGGSALNPTGADTTPCRTAVIRGASWNDSLTSNARGADRDGYEPENRLWIMGFRCAQTAPDLPDDR